MRDRSRTRVASACSKESQPRVPSREEELRGLVHPCLPTARKGSSSIMALVTPRPAVLKQDRRRASPAEKGRRIDGLGKDFNRGSKLDLSPLSRHSGPCARNPSVRRKCGRGGSLANRLHLTRQLNQGFRAQGPE